MTTIANLRVNFTGNTQSFDAATNKVSAGMKSMAAGAAGLISGAALGGVMRSAIDAGSAVYDMTQKTGHSAEFLSSMKMASEQMGASLGAVTAASLRMGKAAEMAAGGNKSMAKYFDELKINAQEFARLNPDEKFRVMADALSKVTDQTRRNFLVTKLMGAGALRLNEIWAGGADALAKIEDGARKANQVISTDQAAAADSAGDAIDTLKASWQGLMTQFGLGLAPEVTRDIEFLTTHLGDMVDMAKKAFSFLHGVGNVAGAVGAAAVAVGTGNFAGAADILGITGNSDAAWRDLFRDPTKDGERAAEQKRTNELLQQQLGLNREMIGVIKDGRVVAQ